MPPYSLLVGLGSLINPFKAKKGTLFNPRFLGNPGEVSQRIARGFGGSLKLALSAGWTNLGFRVRV